MEKHHHSPGNLPVKKIRGSKLDDKARAPVNRQQQKHAKPSSLRHMGVLRLLYILYVYIYIIETR